jgi:hypothetical protein
MLWPMQSNGTIAKLMGQIRQCVIYDRLTFKGVCLCTFHRQLILKYDHRRVHHADVYPTDYTCFHRQETSFLLSRSECN